MNGNYAEAKKNADLLLANVSPHVKEVPPLEGFTTIPTAVEVRFHHWEQLLQMPAHFFRHWQRIFKIRHLVKRWSWYAP